MKRIIYTAAVLLLTLQGYAQNDTTGKNEPDTIKVGTFIIIKKDKDKSVSTDTNHDDYSINIEIGDDTWTGYKGKKKRSNISTNWLIFDLGFANWRDKTVYGSPEANSYLNAQGGDPFTANDLNLNNGKTSNVNIWLFMQKLNIYDHVLNLKYGLGLQMYNFRYETDITYNKTPAYIYRDTVNFSKNKLATDYITIPLMLNVSPFPNKRQGLSFSVGISAGYLYNSRNKQVSDERGKQKVHGNFDLEPWRIAYVGEIGLGPVRVYGSYSTNPLHKYGVKQYPYAFGLRFSNW